MSKKKSALHDGMKIYDTPYYRDDFCEIYEGYNSWYQQCREPSYAVGSTCQYTAFFERQLFQDLLTLFKFKMPEKWDKDFTLWCLFRNGFIAVINTPEYGIIPQPCTLSGKNVFYGPTKALVANTLIKKKGYRIGEDCAIIKLTPDYFGCWDEVHNTAETLGKLWQSLQMAIVNTRAADGYVVDTEAGAQTVRAFLECLDLGVPNFIVSKAMNLKEGQEKPWYEFHNEVGRNYIIDKILADIETTMNQWRRRIGVPVLSDKKERQIQSEIDVVNYNALCAADRFYDTLSESIEKSKKLFGDYGFSVSKPGQEPTKDGDINDSAL